MPEVPFLRVDVSESDYSYLTIYPLVCMHLGSPQSDVTFLKEHLRRIADDPTGRWVYMGDGGECVTKYSKGDVYGQILNPTQQMEMLSDLLMPLRGKGIMGIRGNHGKRIYRETGLDFDQALCARLGIPYLGISAFVHLMVRRSSYTCFFHHGTEGGTSMRAKVAKAESFSAFTMADALFTAHSHACVELPPAPMQYADTRAQQVRLIQRRQYICGCAYDSRTGYAEDHGYPPILPAYLSVRFDGRTIHGQPQYNQQSTVWRSDGNHPILHDYVLTYLERGIV